MAKKDVKKVRRAIGVLDEPIYVTAIENITVMGIGKYTTEAKGTKISDVKSTELNENMVISVFDGVDKEEIIK